MAKKTDKPTAGKPPARRARPLSGTAWGQRLATFGWVAFVTVLAWVWADLERTETEYFTARIRVVAPTQSDIRIVSPGPEGVELRFRIRGPSGRIDEFLRTMRQDEAAGVDPTYVVEASRDWAPGQRELDTERLLNDWPRLRDAGLTAETPSRDTITVAVDRWVTTTARVRLRTSDNAALVGQPTLEPADVRIRVPQTKLDQVGEEPVLNTEEVDLAALSAGPKKEYPVRLSRGIAGVPIELPETTQVLATFDIGERIATRQLTVNVQLTASAEVWARIIEEGYRLEREGSPPYVAWRPTLTIRGSRVEIDKLKPDDDVMAYVKVTDAVLLVTETYPSYKVRVVLPPGVTLQDAPPEVAFRFRQSSLP